MPRPVDVVGHEDVEVAVAVEVGERGVRTPRRVRQSRFGGDVLEGPVPFVAVDDLVADAQQQQVGVAVRVPVGGRGAHGVARGREAGAFGDVLELQAAEVAEEARERARFSGRRQFLHVFFGERSGLEAQHVHPAVAVVVEDRRTGARHFGKQVAARFMARLVREAHARRGGDFLEPRRPSGAGRPDGGRRGDGGRGGRVAAGTEGKRRQKRDDEACMRAWHGGFRCEKGVR
jgi:hypothetical protein